MPARLGRSRRVRKRSEFRRAQSDGVRVTSRRFVFLLRARRDSAPARLGVTASRRVGGAVARNRMKRLIREAFRATLDLWPGGIDVVVIARTAPAGVRFADVVEEWRSVAAILERKCAEAVRRAGRADERSALAKSP